MSERRFGVEFEFCSGGFGRDLRYEQKNRKMINFLRENDLNVDDIYGSTEQWRVGNDGTEFEIKTPILQGENGFREMEYFLDLLNGIGAYTTVLDGSHVHHDAPEFVNNFKLVTGLAETWIANQDEIIKLVNPSRKNNVACAKWNRMHLKRLRSEKSVESSGRRNLNLRSIAKYGSIEIRLHEGTIDYEEISSWIKFGQALIDNTVLNYPTIPKHTTIEHLMKRIKVERNASRFLSMKKQRVATL